jgi:hypothetical protein
MTFTAAELNQIAGALRMRAERRDRAADESSAARSTDKTHEENQRHAGAAATWRKAAADDRQLAEKASLARAGLLDGSGV